MSGQEKTQTKASGESWNEVLTEGVKEPFFDSDVGERSNLHPLLSETQRQKCKSISIKFDLMLLVKEPKSYRVEVELG